LRGAVALGGPGDLAGSRQHLATPCGSDVVRRLMGGGVDEVPERYREGSPAELLPLGVPQIFITGEDDAVVPARFAEDYKKIAAGRGDTVEHIVVKNAAHHEYMAPTSVAWPRVRDAVLSLLGLKQE
ncbi:MAG: alpha/beta hydrolase family protein, partial [Planctomycetota bacterium]